MTVGKDEFRAALSRFASGVTVVTTRDAEGNMHGITVSAFCSVSLEPPMVLICIEKITGSHYAFEESQVFIVNILSHGQDALSEHFASQIPDKFGDVKFHPGIDGVPKLDDALVNLECRMKFEYHGGDHSIFVGEVEKVSFRDNRPLVYFHGDYRTIIS